MLSPFLILPEVIGGKRLEAAGRQVRLFRLGQVAQLLKQAPALPGNKHLTLPSFAGHEHFREDGDRC